VLRNEDRTVCRWLGPLPDSIAPFGAGQIANYGFSGIHFFETGQGSAVIILSHLYAMLYSYSSLLAQTVPKSFRSRTKKRKDEHE
jgi:hypothetical protein